LNQIIDSEEMNIIENKLLKWSKSKLSLRKINSQKYFLNKNSFNNQNKIGLFDDWLLPFNFSSIYKITSKDTLQSEDYDYDIILLPGQQVRLFIYYYFSMFRVTLCIHGGFYIKMMKFKD
jgi:hypothetical protein